eukprot:Skav200341  [mRNA]  locus=scaffold26:94580:96208:+ [translate_table: standard]
MATRICLSPVSTSSLVMFKLSKPLTKAEYFTKARSNQPHLRRRPVVVPYSAPTSWSIIPTFTGFPGVHVNGPPVCPLRSKVAAGPMKVSS